MDFKEARDTARAYFNTQWNDLTPVAWPDVSYKPTKATWVSFTMRHGEGFQASVGAPSSNRFRREGIITIQVFAPENTGANDAADKADAAANIFIGVTNGGISYYGTTINEIGNDDAGFYQINVITKFRYDRLA